MKQLTSRIVSPLLFFLILSACGLVDDGAAEPVATSPSALIERPMLVDKTATAVTISTIEETAVASTARQLIIWLPPEFVAGVNIEDETAVFQQQLNTFKETHPAVEIIVEEKDIEGNGSIFEYLQTGRPVAPTILPHLIVLPIAHLPIAAETGQIQPLSPYLPAEGTVDLYPAAQLMVQVDGEVMGYPIFVNNLTHMMGDSNLFIEGLEPIRWRSMVSKEGVRFAFPAAGTDGALFLLQMYLAEDGRVMDDDGVPVLEMKPLTNALAAFEDANRAGAVIPESRTMSSLDEIWPLFLENEGATVAQTNAFQFLQHQASLNAVTFVPMSGPAKTLTPLLDGWAWALPYSPDESDLTLAAELLNFLSEPAQLAAWSEESGQLPASRTALAKWNSADTPYLQFVDEELENAEQMPVAAHSTIMIALSDAIFNVVSLNQTAVEAAQTAVSTVSP